MGFLSRLFQGRADAANVDVHVLIRGLPELVPVTGMMTVAADAAARLGARLVPDGYGEMRATLRPEPSNPADRDAVAVFVSGERVGYLPSWAAKSLRFDAEGIRACALQVFTERLDRGLRVEAWVWLGSGTPEWQWSRTERPPMSPAAKRRSAERDTDRMVEEAIAGGGDRAAEFRAGMVNGKHYLQLVEPIKQLKREGRLEEALGLCYQAIEGAENEARREKLDPPPFYTEQAAIIHRKRGERKKEIAVLSRYLAACAPERRGGRIQERLEKILA